MKIEVFEQEDGLGNEPEVWVKIQTDELLDWPRYKTHLDPAQARVVAGCQRNPQSRTEVFAYHPADAEPGSGFRFEEWFVLKPEGGNL